MRQWLPHTGGVTQRRCYDPRKFGKKQQQRPHRGYRDHQAGKWAAPLSFCGRTQYLGSFTEFMNVIKARKRAEEEAYAPFLARYYEENKKKKKQNITGQRYNWSKVRATRGVRPFLYVYREVRKNAIK